MSSGKVGAPGILSGAFSVLSLAVGIGDFKWSLGAQILYGMTAAMLLYAFAVM